jgi:hypothetical protein
MLGVARRPINISPRKGFVISLTGSDRDLRDIVAERRPLFERLLAWRAPSSPQ